MKNILFLLLALAPISSAATKWALTKNADGTTTFPSVTAANSSIFELDGSGNLVLTAKSTYAMDNAVVKLTGNQSIAGDKSFSGSTQTFSLRMEGLITYGATSTFVYESPAESLAHVTALGGAAPTGTGGLVRTTSPTLVTPTLGTPASGNFSSGTFTWPTFNQSTTGNAATVTNLTLGSATSITGGGTIALGGFTATIPATGTVAVLGTANTFTAANSVTDATNATSPTTGCLKLTGGLGVAKDIYCADIYLKNPSFSAMRLSANSEGIQSINKWFVLDTTQSTTTSTGALQTLGGIGVAKNANIGGTTTATGGLILPPDTRTGPGAVALTSATTKLVSTGVLDAITFANGTAEGQLKTIVHSTDGGSAVLTPAAASGFTTVTFTNVGESVTLQWFTGGWVIVSIRGAVAA